MSAGFISNLFGFNGNNNSTEDAFKNSGKGGQHFKDAKLNTGSQVAHGHGRHASCRGTEDAFKNSGGGQNFRNAEFNTGVEVAHGTHAPCSGNNGTKDAFKNSGLGEQVFEGAKFKTGATYN